MRKKAKSGSIYFFKILEFSKAAALLSWVIQPCIKTPFPEI